MTVRWLFASGADRRLLGGRRLRAATPWVIAIMSFSIVIIAATGLALANAASVLTHSIEGRYALEVPAGAGKLDELTRALKISPGVSGVAPIPEQEMRKTLEQWLGPAAESGELPVPALINFDMAPGSDLRLVTARVRAVEPSASITAHQDSVAPLLDSLRGLEWLALVLVLLLCGAASAAVVLAARGALDTHRSTIDVMHGIGATDLQLTHLFQRRIAIDSFIGSIAGALAAGLVLLLFAGGSAFAGQLTGGPPLSLADVAILALLPLALTALATWVARAAVLAALRRSL